MFGLTAALMVALAYGANAVPAGSIINDIPSLPNPLGPLLSNNTFDYVIVGAGTAGMTLAARLSEDPKVKVAVVEAGVDYTSNGINQFVCIRAFLL
jgi:choline dehydrogenase